MSQNLTSQFVVRRLGEKGSLHSSWKRSGTTFRHYESAGVTQFGCNWFQRLQQMLSSRFNACNETVPLIKHFLFENRWLQAGEKAFMSVAGTTSLLLKARSLSWYLQQHGCAAWFCKVSMEQCGGQWLRCLGALMLNTAAA